jgi:hypothetical protein
VQDDRQPGRQSAYTSGLAGHWGLHQNLKSAI